MDHFPPSNKSLEDTKEQKKIIVAHNVRTPITDPTRMLDDAYQIVAMQLSRFRGKAGITEFDVKDATALHKLVCTLKLLEQSEQNRVSTFQLDGLSQETLENLAIEARNYRKTDNNGQ